MKVLVTCPPMLSSKEQFIPLFKENNIDVFCPDVTQTLSEDELVDLLPQFDGWIIGDDPATRRVFEAGKKGIFKAAVKWGIGVDNVDFDACMDLNIPITNTPGMFGSEVAELAIGYLVGLARETYLIDREVRSGKWPKNAGITLEHKTIGIVGYGDIGENLTKKAKAFGLNIIIYDPAFNSVEDDEIKIYPWPENISYCDFVVFTCSLNSKNYHMFNKEVISKCKDGVRVINVARGGLIKESDLCDSLKQGKVHSAALDVFENEPVSSNSYLLSHPLCILGSHNASNTYDAVSRTNKAAIEKLFNFLGV